MWVREQRMFENIVKPVDIWLWLESSLLILRKHHDEAGEKAGAAHVCWIIYLFIYLINFEGSILTNDVFPNISSYSLIFLPEKKICKNKIK
jgi:hypothetical protein